MLSKMEEIIEKLTKNLEELLYIDYDSFNDGLNKKIGSIFKEDYHYTSRNRYYKYCPPRIRRGYPYKRIKRNRRRRK